MKLKKLLENVKTLSSYNNEAEVKLITDNSKKVGPECVFVCIKGNKFDGHEFAAKAVDLGAQAVICDHDIGIKQQVIVENTREAYSLMCSSFYNNEHKKLKIIGITGTNGKTTTAFLIKKILEDSGKKVGLIGTVSIMIGDKKTDAVLTTPDPFDLHRYFKDMVDAKCEYCVMEVSSQALDQKRVCGIEYECSAFSNLTPEHLDYHKTMENYAKAKAMLFSMSKTAVINIDDEYGEYMLNSCRCKAYTISTESSADYKAEKIELEPDKVEYTLSHNGELTDVGFHTPGMFSVYNSITAIAVTDCLNISCGNAAESVKSIKGIAGRMERVDIDTPFHVIIDYAHTPDSLENILKTLKPITKGKLIIVFGCGGDRDATKRPIMGKIAVTYADVAIATSDNPRTEDPQKILDDVVSGMKCDNSCKVISICNRTEAIEKALRMAKKDDVIALAGKGHETYQILGTKKIHYDEKEIVKGLIEKIQGENE